MKSTPEHTGKSRVRTGENSQQKNQVFTDPHVREVLVQLNLHQGEGEAFLTQVWEHIANAKAIAGDKLVDVNVLSDLSDFNTFYIAFGFQSTSGHEPEDVAAIIKPSQDSRWSVFSGRLPQDLVIVGPPEMTY